MKIKAKEFRFRHESFTMVFPPILNSNFTVNPEDESCNPEEDPGLAMRVVRGGAFNDDAEECWVDL